MIDRTHEVFDVPADDTVIWRYMDLGRFLAIIQTSSLFLSRADLLGDPHEGSYSPLNLSMREQLAEGVPGYADVDRRALRQWMYVNCWHMNPRESAAMWGLYQAEGRGIAIRSTVGDLDQALRNDQLIYLGSVAYIDYQTTVIPEANLLYSIMAKRLSFEHEREARLVTMRFPDTELVDPDRPEEGTQHIPGWVGPVGVPVPIDVERLVRAIHLAPDTPSWFGDVVRVIARHAGLSAPINQSDIDAPPLF